MATFTFKTVTNGSAKFKKDSEFWHIIEDGDTLDQIGATRLRMTGHNGAYDIDVSTDTVIIDLTTYPPGSSFDTVYDALNPLFRIAKTGTGGTGTVDLSNYYTKAEIDQKLANLTTA